MRIYDFFNLELVAYGIILAVLWWFLAKITSGRDKRHVKFASTLPGPPSIPVFGNIIGLALAARTDSSNILAEYVKKYGGRFRLWLGNYLYVVVSEADDLEYIFRSSRIIRIPKYVSESYRKFWGEAAFSVSEVDEWKVHRKRWQPFFTHEGIGSSISEINEAIYELVDVWKKYYANGTEFNAIDTLTKMFFMITSRKEYNYKTDMEDEIASFFESNEMKAEFIITLQMLIPMLNTKLLNYIIHKFVLNSVKRRLRECSKTIITRTRKEDEFLLNEHNSASLYKRKQDASINTSILEDVIFVMGTIYNTSTMTALILLMIAMHPEIQSKLHAEIDHVFGNDDEPATVKDLDQVVKETLRRFTLIPLNFRELQEDIKIETTLFPTGTYVMINTVGIHLHPEYYPEPLKFNPNNFTSDAVKKRPKYTFMPFGAGMQMCPGKNFAETEIKLTLVALLKTFRFRTSLNMEDINPTIEGFRIGSTRGYPISIGLRNSNKN